MGEDINKYWERKFMQRKEESLCDTGACRTMMPLGNFYFWRNWSSKVGDLGDTRQSHWWLWGTKLKVRALNGRQQEKWIFKPYSMLSMPASRLYRPRQRFILDQLFSNFNFHMILLGILLKMQILMQSIWGGPEVLYSNRPLDDVGSVGLWTHYVQQGFRVHSSPDWTWKHFTGVREEMLQLVFIKKVGN